MNTSLTVLIVLAALTLFAALFVLGIYNKLVAPRNRFQNAYDQIDAQLKRRYDLIPNLVEKGVEFARECLIFGVRQPQQAKRVLDENLSVSTALSDPAVSGDRRKTVEDTFTK